jgi:tetrahydromethanopterin S-methyltransferase subunit G
MNLRFAQVNGRFSELRDDMNLRLAEITARFDGLQADVSRRFWDLDQKIDRHFTWLVGTQIAVFLAVVSALIGALYR